MLKKKNAALQDIEMKKKKAASQISTKSFFVVVSLLLLILFACWILTFIIPQGSYQRDEAGMIITGTYTRGQTKGLAFWRLLTAPFRVFASSDGLTVIMISVFLLVMNGVFNLLEKTDGTKIIIS